MTGYVRKDTTNNIADGNVINAADLDAEFDGVQDAFNASTGHKHDGTAGEGATINALGPTQDVTISATLLAPKTTNTVDIGSSALKFKDLFLAGNSSVGGTLAVTGVATFTAQPILSSLTASRAVFSDGSKGLVSNAITGTGNVVMSASPTLTGTIDAAAATLSGNLTLSGGTANGVAYLNGSKVVTSGSALTFDGTNFFGGTNTYVTGRFYAQRSSSSLNLPIAGYTDGSAGAVLSGTKGDIVAFGNAGGDGVIFANANAEQMRLTSTGLGIGTSSVNTRLHVVGLNQTNGTAEFTPNASKGSNASYVHYGTNGDWYIRSASSSGNVNIQDTGGNVGIGTSSPAAKLHIKGSSNPAIYWENSSFGSATNAAFMGSAGQLVFGRAGVADWLTIDNSGRLGLGMTPSGSYSLQIYGVGASAGSARIRLNNSSTGTADADGGGIAMEGVDLVIQNSENGVCKWEINGSERARIDSSGNLLVGATSQLGGGSYGNNQIQASVGDGGRAALVVYNSNALDNAPALNAIKNSATTTSSQRFIQFYANAGATAMGGIVGNGASNVQFAAISDAREKTNVQPISGSLEKISALKPVAFDWIQSGEHVKSGFIAQDVEQVFPEFVVENMSGEGEESRKGLTGGMTSGIIPHLVKALQEQQAIIESLKARLDAANL